MTNWREICGPGTASLFFWTPTNGARPTLQHCRLRLFIPSSLRLGFGSGPRKGKLTGGTCTSPTSGLSEKRGTGRAFRKLSTKTLQRCSTTMSFLFFFETSAFNKEVLRHQQHPDTNEKTHPASKHCQLRALSLPRFNKHPTHWPNRPRLPWISRRSRVC